MKLNQTAVLVVVGALAAVAVGLWATKSPPTPKATPKPTIAKPDVAPVAPPTPLPSAVTAITDAQPAGMPINPTQTGELPPMREAWAFYTPIDSQENLQKLIDLAVKSSGGEKAQRALLAAKWKLTASLPGRTLFLDMQTDVDGSIAVRDEQTGVEWFLVHDECFIRHGKLVSACLGESELFIHGLAAGQLSALPLRLKQAKIELDDVTDGRSVVFIQLPGAAEHRPTRVQISRETGAVTRVNWSTISAFPTRRYGDEDWAVPEEWAITWWADPSKSPGGSAAKGKIDEKQRPVLARINVRASEVTPLKDKGLIKAPALTTSEPLSVYARPALTGVLIQEGFPASIEKVADSVVKIAQLDGLLDLLLCESFAPAQEVSNLTHGAELWILVPTLSVPRYAKTQKIREVAPEARVARKALRTTWADLPDQLVKFVGEVAAAGHKAGTGPTMVTLLPAEGNGEFVAELQVPLAAK